MSDDLIIIMVLQILGIVSGLLTPLIMAVSTFIGRIEHSECLKSKIDLSEVKIDNNFGNSKIDKKNKNKKENEKSNRSNDDYDERTEQTGLKRSPNMDISYHIP